MPKINREEYESEETEVKTLESIRAEIWVEMKRLEDDRKYRGADIKYHTLREVLQKLGHLDEPEAEKTKDSKNSFYWFTAKRTPLVVDVSYLSYEDTLYGFKGVPNYRFIEKHDLRFVTHCPLDDLIEQYR